MPEPAPSRRVRVNPAGRDVTALWLWHVPARAVPLAVARMALDRWHLGRAPDLAFWKLLGTGDGATFTPGDADVRRWGLVGVFPDARALADFERTSPTIAAWAGLAEERWRGDLVPLRTRGTWSGRTPFHPRPPLTPGWDGVVASITRARLRWSLQRPFWRAVRPVATDANARQGLRLAVGIGEAPIGLQGTFSVWDSAEDLTAFAYRGAPHRAAIAETERRDWYAEELFTRFALVGSTGTVDGRDPLVG